MFMAVVFVVIGLVMVIKAMMVTKDNMGNGSKKKAKLTKR